MDKVVVGVATLPSRHSFFSKKVLPNLIEMADEVWVYTDRERPDLTRHSSIGTKVADCKKQSIGDAGKFLGCQKTRMPMFYYLSCDDDLIYPLDYAEKMIEWIEFLNRRAIVSLHGSTFSQMPVDSYYKRKNTIPCLGVFPTAQRVIFPGSGAAGFHSSAIEIDVDNQFLSRNMADIWFGKLLQDQSVPSVVLPHSADYLTYNKGLSITETIWGQEADRDFLQTAVINQMSLHPGLRLFPLDWPEESHPESFGHLQEETPELLPDSQE